MDKNSILYRGSLKSCNYRCSYCPFSKRKSSRTELDRDRKQWFSFIESLAERAAAWHIHALLVAPHGEALLHPWYWEGLARLSALDVMEAVGAQTNLSFPAHHSLALFRRAGGDVHRLRLWATFHPEMISAQQFAGKCIQIRQAGIMLCAGAVGAPENIDRIQELRRLLPREIYLWINRMNPPRSPYTKEEISAFLDIDPYFFRELTYPPGEPAKCRGRLFVEGDGRLRACNIAEPFEERWSQWRGQSFAPSCSRKKCSCYLAYGGQKDFMNRILFGDYPIFRIPRRPKAVFLDIQGTLIPPGSSSIPRRTVLALTALTQENAPLFFATTLPYPDALKRCRNALHLFSGGIFAGGAHLVWENKKERREEFHFFPEDILPWLRALKEKWRFRILAYERRNKIYKITLLRPGRRPWTQREAAEIWEEIPTGCRKLFRCYTEGCCLQIVSAKASKANGAQTLCRWLGISPQQAVGAGDSQEDAAMPSLLSSLYRSH